jgi:hypothetical protein
MVYVAERVKVEASSQVRRRRKVRVVLVIANVHARLVLFHFRLKIFVSVFKTYCLLVVKFTGSLGPRMKKGKVLYCWRGTVKNLSDV